MTPLRPDQSLEKAPRILTVAEETHAARFGFALLGALFGSIAWLPFLGAPVSGMEFTHTALLGQLASNDSFAHWLLTPLPGESTFGVRLLTFLVSEFTGGSGQAIRAVLIGLSSLSAAVVAASAAAVAGVVHPGRRLDRTTSLLGFLLAFHNSGVGTVADLGGVATPFQSALSAAAVALWVVGAPSQRTGFLPTMRTTLPALAMLLVAVALGASPVIFAAGPVLVVVLRAAAPAPEAPPAIRGPALVLAALILPSAMVALQLTGLPAAPDSAELKRALLAPLESLSAMQLTGPGGLTGSPASLAFGVLAVVFSLIALGDLARIAVRRLRVPAFVLAAAMLPFVLCDVASGLTTPLPVGAMKGTLVAIGFVAAIAIGPNVRNFLWSIVFLVAASGVGTLGASGLLGQRSLIVLAQERAAAADSLRRAAREFEATSGRLESVRLVAPNEAQLAAYPSKRILGYILGIGADDVQVHRTIPSAGEAPRATGTAVIEVGPDGTARLVP